MRSQSPIIYGRVRTTLLLASFVCAVAVLFCAPTNELSPTAKAQRTCTVPKNPFELVPQQFSKNAPPTDVNGFLLNPQWAWQVNCPVQIENGIPKPRLENFPDSIDPEMCKEYDFSDCDGEARQTSFDEVGFCPMCNLGRRRKNRRLGHVNWFPATYTGDICFHNTSYPDMDYTFSLRPKMGAGLTRWNHPSKPNRDGTPKDPNILPQAIHVEFDSRETVNFFRSEIWSKFRGDASPCSNFRNSCNIENAMNTISMKRAVVFGLIGLDSEHDIYSESHPVYAIAIEIDPDRTKNTWIVFARNTGNEGNCSSHDHPLIWPPDSGQLVETLKILIPPPPGIQVKEVSAVSTQFFSNNDTCPELSYYQEQNFSEDNEGVLVTFNLRPCPQNSQCQPLVEGQITLAWTGPGGVREAVQAEDKCLSRAEQEREESERYKEPTPTQTARLLRLLAEERAEGVRTMNECPSGVNVTIPRSRVVIERASSVIMEAMPATKGERVRKNYKKISDIIFPN